MSIDISKLENVKNTGNKIVARCPACAESGQDKKGNHLIINNDGKFACVMFQGAFGHEHRKRIFRLAGIKETPKNTITVKQASQTSHERREIIMDDVLGRLGHIKSTCMQKGVTIFTDNNIEEGLNETVPSVTKDKIMQATKVWTKLQKDG